eukprot:CAMPEP_0202686788 /NCGR_PEP_ID=MMETSP1385-20130828/2560_1 /ASSEMBLY_ACC=CAM_ASM_000861 /TAXON_ID=933848 /ORGANISM="Elphidium margaritaceum" /LENGTH=330 /DNA_ID=CAMNT_0049341445 /DNA_START=202 /DNA_END=1194 /DNA_ORIENTATION=+
MALKYHPDKVKDAEDREKAEEIFKELAHCYEILSDKEQRQKYDASGYNEQFAQQPGGTGGGANFKFEGSFEDIFSSFFGQGNRFGFENLFGSAGSKAGFGGGDHAGFGSFQFGGDTPGGFGGGGPRQQAAPNMRGTRQQQARPNKPAPHKVYVTLEELMEDSTRSVKNAGRITIAKGAPEGHIVEENGARFEIRTRPHALFVRGERSHKSDLYTNVSVRAHDALLGFTLKLRGVDGEWIEEWMESVPPSKQYQIKRKGLPRFEGSSRGHLYVYFDVEIPTLTEGQKQALRTHLQEHGAWDYTEVEAYKKKQRQREEKRKKRQNIKDKTEL